MISVLGSLVLLVAIFGAVARVISSERADGRRRSRGYAGNGGAGFVAPGDGGGHHGGGDGGSSGCSGGSSGCSGGGCGGGGCGGGG